MFWFAVNTRSRPGKGFTSKLNNENRKSSVVSHSSAVTDPGHVAFMSLNLLRGFETREMLQGTRRTLFCPDFSARFRSLFSLNSFSSNCLLQSKQSLRLSPDRSNNLCSTSSGCLLSPIPLIIPYPLVPLPTVVPSFTIPYQGWTPSASCIVIVPSCL